MSRDYKGFGNQKCTGVIEILNGDRCIQVGVLSGGKWDKLHDNCRRRPPLKDLSRRLKANKHDGCVIEPTYRIRKRTPKECIRLMDFDDSDYDKIKAIVMSDSQIYKQCGNSIVVACLEGIFRKMFIHTEVENEQLSLF